MAYVFAYITTPTIEEARRIGKAAVEAKLAACANILPQMESIYHWAGKTEESKECVLLLKTKDKMFDRLKDFVLSTHSYDCPCVVALPITQGAAPYFEWLENSLK
jgi:periplasmic divalent cation tolerance protein